MQSLHFIWLLCSWRATEIEIMRQRSLSQSAHGSPLIALTLARNPTSNSHPPTRIIMHSYSSYRTSIWRLSVTNFNNYVQSGTNAMSSFMVKTMAHQPDSKPRLTGQEVVTSVDLKLDRCLPWSYFCSSWLGSRRFHPVQWCHPFTTWQPQMITLVTKRPRGSLWTFGPR